MGCDGGTIPRRDELVRVKKKPEQKDKEAELAYRWKHCSIRQLPLQPPIVACGLGRLYSKESVLEGLLDRTTLPESAGHIKSLKDVKTLNLTPNPAYDGDLAKNGGYQDDGKSAYICPVIGLEMTGKYKFCFLWSCGCVVSERALKEIKSYVCHKCQKPFAETDIVVLNAQDDDLTAMQENIVARKAEKKSKKRANNGSAISSTSTATATATSTATSTSASTALKAESDEPKKQQLPNGLASTCALVGVEKTFEESTTSASKKVKKEKTEAPEVKLEKPKEEASSYLSSNGKRAKRDNKAEATTTATAATARTKSKTVRDPAYDKAKDEYSVARDPRASEVLKSIFTSHKSASEQTRAHWVTYNPFYN